MVAYGVVHGCIGECCSIDYPSVFTSLGDEDVLSFLNGFGTTINIDNITAKNEGTTSKVLIGILICSVIGLLVLVGILYIRKSR